VARRRNRDRSGRPRQQVKRGQPAVAAARTEFSEAQTVKRLTYTRRQAAEALGISATTLTRRVLPLLETVQTPWGSTLVPVEEVERFVAEYRRPAAPNHPRAGGRRAASTDVAQRIVHARARGATYRTIAAELDAEAIPTPQGGRSWWPSTVRHVAMTRSSPPR